MPKYKNWFWLAALTAACAFDVLFWKKPTGISFVIWTAILLDIGYLLAWREGKRPAKASMLIALMVLFFAFVPGWRNEPFTKAFSVLLAFAGMILLTATFLNGHWFYYRIWDFLTKMILAVVGGVSRAILLLSKNSNPTDENSPTKKSFWKKMLPVLRGVLIALPIVSLMAILLSSADPVFGDWLKRILDLEKLPETLFRVFYITIIGGFLVGIYLHAIVTVRPEKRPDPQKAWMKPFLGWTETAIILGLVDVLFVAFVFIQIRYLFGGTVNINETGYTFSEYARRGFGELVAVAVLSMLLYLGLNTISKRENRFAKVGFSAVSILLLANVLVILSSSLQRLMLYENAYGFSQLRTYTHVFIYYLAGLILVTIVLDVIRKRGHFALVLLICIVGFGATLPIMNVDRFIAQKNIQRAVSGEDLDVQYLNSLSIDSVPVSLDQYLNGKLPTSVEVALGYSLSCRAALTDDATRIPWQGFNIGGWNGYGLLHENPQIRSEYKVYQTSDLVWSYRLNGKEIPCLGPYLMD
ncbi:MAG: DUF4173 domain-containing protein [Chloroflexi bacterium]|nr:DUF4173 domain-containing protein [Chloroflexota bacterium]